MRCAPAEYGLVFCGFTIGADHDHAATFRKRNSVLVFQGELPRLHRKLGFTKCRFDRHMPARATDFGDTPPVSAQPHQWTAPGERGRGRGDRSAHCAMAPAIAALLLSRAAAPQVPSGASVRASHCSAEAKSEFSRAAQKKNGLVHPAMT